MLGGFSLDFTWILADLYGLVKRIIKKIKKLHSYSKYSGCVFIRLN